MCLQLLMYLCVCVPSWVRGAQTPYDGGVCIFLLQQRPPACDGVTVGVCVSVFQGVCVCVCLGQTLLYPVNPSTRSTPLQALCANETFPYRKWIPPALCTRPNQYSSCKTYFTEMALSQRVKAGKGRDLSVIHCYLWPLWCEGILMILWEGMHRLCSALVLFCVSGQIPLHFMNKVNLILLTNNHWSVICEFKRWSMSSDSWLHSFVRAESVNLIFLWLAKHLPAGEPQRHPP